MEFLDPIERKKKSRRLFIGYALVTVLITLATYILVATAVGYEIFPRNGTIVQNGLLFLNSSPVSASIEINGKMESNRTEAKLALGAGLYDVKLSSEGYTDWNKKIVVEGGKVRFVTYPKLFPNTLNPESIKSLSPKTGFASQSLDRKWLLVQPNTDLPSIEVFDLQADPVSSVSFVLPTTSVINVDGAYGIFEPIEWSDDNRHLLLKQTAPDSKVNFILVDRQSADASVNLNQIFSANPTSVQLFDKKFDKYYFYFADGGLIRVADLKAKTVADAIVDQALGFKSYGDNLILYVSAKDAEQGKVSAKIWDNSKIYQLSQTTYDADGRYLLDIAKYRNVWYYVVGSHASDRVVVYRNPIDVLSQKDPAKAPIAATLRIGSPEAIAFSTNARFIMTYSGQSVTTYDAEDKLTYKFETKQRDNLSKITWMDGHRLQYITEGNIEVVEFDGANSRQLISVKSPYTGYFSNDYETLFSIINNSESINYLQQTSLLAKQN